MNINMDAKERNKFEQCSNDDADENLKRSMLENYIHNRQFLSVVCLLVIGLICNVMSIISNYWVCDGKSQEHYGLWDSCVQMNDTNSNLTMTQCAIQTVNDIYFIYAEQQLIEEINLGKSLLVVSLFLHFISIVILLFTFFYSKFTNKKNFIYLIRNLLVLCLIFIMTAILIQIIGFFLFIYGEKLSTGCFVLFIYFLFAIFITNTINFFTIKYKSIYHDLLFALPVVQVNEENMKY